MFGEQTKKRSLNATTTPSDVGRARGRVDAEVTPLAGGPRFSVSAGAWSRALAAPDSNLGLDPVQRKQGATRASTFTCACHRVVG